VAPIEENKYQLADRIWLECMERIGRKETTLFENNNVAYTEDVIVGNCRRHIMCWIYSVLKGHKKLKPIEELEREVKEQMWAFVKEICLNKTNDKKRMIEIAKTFYVIEYFLNENKCQ